MKDKLILLALTLSTILSTSTQSEVTVTSKIIDIEEKCSHLNEGMHLSEAYSIMKLAQRKTKSTHQKGYGFVKLWNDEMFSQKKAGPALIPYGKICKVKFNSNEIVTSIEFINE